MGRKQFELRISLIKVQTKSKPLLYIVFQYGKHYITLYLKESEYIIWLYLFLEKKEHFHSTYKLVHKIILQTKYNLLQYKISK